MRLIAHRGLTQGPDAKLENRPEQIEKSLSESYDCEIDVWYKDEKWFLGHDYPDYNVSAKFLEQPNLWLHCKNLEALSLLLYPVDAYTTFNCFWHDSDDFTLTNFGFIWTYPGKPLTENSICVLPEWDKTIDLSTYQPKCYGVCSDYVSLMKK